MNGMFYQCSSLSSLDLSGFNTQKVTDMSYMFYKCLFLLNLNISHFSSNNNTNLEGIFEGIQLCKIICSDNKIKSQKKA
jgi:surface protein